MASSTTQRLLITVRITVDIYGTLIYMASIGRRIVRIYKAVRMTVVFAKERSEEGVNGGIVCRTFCCEVWRYSDWF